MDNFDVECVCHESVDNRMGKDLPGLLAESRAPPAKRIGLHS